MRSNIWYHGVCSDTFGVYIERRPPRIIPQRRYTRYTIPGRSGEKLKMQRGWENYIQPYEIAIVPLLTESDLSKQIDKVAEWLLYPGDYQRLEDSYNPGVYRLAAVTNAMEVTNQLGKFGRATLQMECLPERWFLDAETWRQIDLSESFSSLNPTPNDAEPLISITGRGVFGWRLQNTAAGLDVTYKFNVTGTRNKTIRVYGENAGDAAYSDGTNANGITTVTAAGTAGKLPIIPATGTTILTPVITETEGVADGVITEMWIKPRWFIV